MKFHDFVHDFFHENLSKLYEMMKMHNARGRGVGRLGHSRKFFLEIVEEMAGKWILGGVPEGTPSGVPKKSGWVGRLDPPGGLKKRPVSNYQGVQVPYFFWNKVVLRLGRG